MGHTEIAVWMKRGPQRPIVMAVNVLEAWVTPKFGASTVGASSAKGKVGVSTSGPYKKPFPIREQEPVAVSPGSAQAMSIDTNSYQELTFPSEIIDVGYSDGGIVGAFAIHNRALAITGIASGQVELFIRTRRFESDEVGQVQRYAITVVKAAPEAPVLWKEREKTLKAEIKKQDARILELEKELARRNG
ncbi:hypothetical protein EON80_19420 [bacterium]|nr:MAG: hypothetical protein EON80_19420 [bacterium]